PRAIRSFPTRRSSDLHARASAAERAMDAMSHEIRSPLSAIIRYSEALRMGRVHNLTPAQRAGIAQINADAVELLELAVRRLDARSEEHTSELQSPDHL